MFHTHQPERPTKSTAPDRTRLLTPRAMLILLLAVLTGIGAGALTALTGRHPAEAILVALATSAAAVTFFDRLVGHG